MYAIIETGGKQYRVSEGDQIRIEKIKAADGEQVKFDKVLVLGEGAEAKVGAPYVESAAVFGDVIETGKGKKVIIFKYKACLLYTSFFTRESSKKKCSSNIFSIKAIIVRRGWPSAISAILAQSRATKSTGTNKEKNKRNRILCRPDRVKQQNKPVITEFNVVHSRVKQ